MTWTAAVGWFFTGYALLTGIFLLLENRRPQATLAWMLLFLSLPGVGVLVYVLFGRGRKAFSKQSKLLMQDIEGNIRPLLEPILERQDAEISRLEGHSASRRKLMMLVRRNSRSGLSRRNRVQIQQDAAVFYPSLIEDMKAARHSIHLQYFIWAADPFTEILKRILIEKARAGVRVRLLYDPIGSQAHLSRAYMESMRFCGAAKLRPVCGPCYCRSSCRGTSARM